MADPPDQATLEALQQATKKAEEAAEKAEKAAGLSSGGSGSIRAIGGLIAVVVGVTAVTGLAIVTLTQLESSNKDSIVAITSSAFGIISAVVGAYLGIKISSETNAKASDEAKNAAVAQHVARVTNSELEAVKATANDLVTPDQAAQIRAARIAAGEQAARFTGPHPGGGSA
jgi:hypothetical protein